MLYLDDPRWIELRDAYGSAAGIPQLLRDLAASPGQAPSWQSEPWYSLWSSLCHQGDVYTASYAAVPHIVEIAQNTTGAIDFSFLQLPASIELARHKGRGPKIPDDLLDAYNRAVTLLPTCISNHRDDPWDDAMLLSVCLAQAVAKGHFVIAEAITNLDPDLIDKLAKGEIEY